MHITNLVTNFHYSPVSSIFFSLYEFPHRRQKQVNPYLNLVFALGQPTGAWGSCSVLHCPSFDHLGTFPRDSPTRGFSDGKGCEALFQCNNVTWVKCSWFKVGSISITGKIFHLKAISKKVFLLGEKNKSN